MSLRKRPHSFIVMLKNSGFENKTDLKRKSCSCSDRSMAKRLEYLRIYEHLHKMTQVTEYLHRNQQRAWRYRVHYWDIYRAYYSETYDFHWYVSYPYLLLLTASIPLTSPARIRISLTSHYHLRPTHRIITTRWKMQKYRAAQEPERAMFIIPLPHRVCVCPAGPEHVGVHSAKIIIAITCCCCCCCCCTCRPQAGTTRAISSRPRPALSRDSLIASRPRCGDYVRAPTARHLLFFSFPSSSGGVCGDTRAQLRVEIAAPLFLRLHVFFSSRARVFGRFIYCELSEFFEWL